MSTLTGFIRRHPLVSYFTLAFLLSWGGVFLAVGHAGFPATPEHAAALLPLGVMTMLTGPPIAGLLLTGLIDGKTGLRRLGSRLLDWRVPLGWYAIALLTGPLLVAATILPLFLASPVFRPGLFTSDNRAGFLLISIAYGLAAGGFEETGWTGFAVPRLRLRYGVFATGLLLGLIWGVWHFLSNFWGSGTPSGGLSLDLFLPAQLFAVAALPPYRVLMVWVYDRTGSLLLAVLMHATFTAGWLIAMPAGISGRPFLIWYLVLAAALWLTVGAVAWTHRGHLSPQPLHRMAT